jgi:hypothetical protein
MRREGNDGDISNVPRDFDMFVGSYSIHESHLL